PVVVVGPVMPPPPVCTANVTPTPLTGWLAESRTITDGGTLRANPARPELSPSKTAMLVGVPGAMDVAVKLTGLPVMAPPPPLTVALNPCAPAVPSVQLPTTATPEAFVVTVAPVSVPPPEVTANATVAEGLGFPKPSFTITAGGVATAVPCAAVWASPACTATLAGAPAVAVAWNTAAVTFGAVAETD